MNQAALQRTLCAIVLAAAAAPGLALESAAAPAGSEAFTRHLAGLINDYRRAQGLAPLSVAEDLAAIAGEHSSTMAERRQLSHEGFSARFRFTGSKVCVENVGRNYPTPETLLDGWRLSPDHHRNLLEPKVARMGIAATGRYVTFFACR
ncbi:MAG: CAP domain-containing protein [Burkholderiales bacterium]|nr:CAP domain-containing protein [Burkholderiales bacterium]